MTLRNFFQKIKSQIIDPRIFSFQMWILAGCGLKWVRT